jgi:dolichol-phosphate mannosyltransferase
VVFSFRNEVDVIPELIARVGKALDAASVDYQLLFVNDASTDGSRELLERLAAADPRIALINMSRRFGPSECALAGLRHAQGDAAIVMDSDLQDPPELLPTLIAHWRQGADVVHTTRTARLGESRLKMAATRLAYRILGSVSNIELVTDAGDFKLFGRRALDELLQLREATPYLRGLVVWIGFTQVFVPYERQARFAGKTHFPFFSLNPWRTFFSGLTSFSSLPLAVLVPMGLALVAMGALGAVAAALWFNSTPGWGWVIVLLLLLTGLQTTGLGIVGIYLARVYAEVRGRPHYIIESTVGLPEAKPFPTSARHP